MKRGTSMIIALMTALLVAAPASAREKLPQTTKDGLELQEHSKVMAVYLKPGASLAAYDKVAITDVLVSFKKNWQRDYNQDVVRLDAKVTDADMEKMKKEIGDEFKKVFTDVLQKGGYEMSTVVGPDVMIIRPAIINLEVAAPDTGSPAFGGVTIVRSAGSLTMYAELLDSVTNDKFAEVLDTEDPGEGGFAQRATRVSNKAALDSTLRHWAELLVKRLDEAHGKKK